MQTTKVSPELQAISDRAYLYAYGIDEAYKHLYKTLVEPDYPANRFQIIRHLADDKYTAHVSKQRYIAPDGLAGCRRRAGDRLGARPR